MQKDMVFGAYAIIETGGKQYQAIPGKTVALEKLEGNVGDAVQFDKVLLRKTDAGNVEVGAPFLDSPVKGSIVRQMRDRKIVVFRFKRRKKVRVKKGHRQYKTVVRIEAI